jgi:peroxiredoxin
MSRFSKIIIFAAAMVAAAACSSNARIEGELAGAPSSEVVVKLLNINHYEVLDTVKTDAAGKFSYKAEIAKGQPEFIYVFYKDTKVASLLLEAGDKVSVTADTLGTYEVAGSEESLKLAQIEKEYTEALARLTALSAQSMTTKGAEYDEIRRQIGQEYINYYRSRVKYVMENSKSLTAVPVLFQNFGSDLPVFAQATDAIHFTNVSDSLEAVYPDSRYVKALRKEAEKRFGYMELEHRLKNATEVGFFDVELPDINSQKKKLSDIDAKVIMLYFWSATDTDQKMFNLDVLKSLYEDYNHKGFEIYQVALDPDKAAWARVMKTQNLPWVNVCDFRGAASPYVGAYNLGALPATFLIKDGELVDGQAVDEKAFRRLLDKLLK